MLGGSPKIPFRAFSAVDTGHVLGGQDVWNQVQLGQQYGIDFPDFQEVKQHQQAASPNRK